MLLLYYHYHIIIIIIIIIIIVIIIAIIIIIIIIIIISLLLMIFVFKYIHLWHDIIFYWLLRLILNVNGVLTFFETKLTSGAEFIGSTVYMCFTSLSSWYSNRDPFECYISIRSYESTLTRHLPTCIAIRLFIVCIRKKCNHAIIQFFPACLI